MSAHLAAVDLGATSGRVMVAGVAPGSIDIAPVARFANDPVYLWNGRRAAMHWDLPGLFRNVCDGLAEATRRYPDLAGIGVDSWAVDYGLLRGGALAALPHHYRDARCEDGADTVHQRITHPELYARNGLQYLPFNTLYQLATDALGDVDRALLIPDLVNYWLTGREATERTNASTTGLLGIDGHWDDELMTLLDIPTDLFPAVVDPGTELGPPLPHLATLSGITGRPHVSTVASHDTASAVVAVPMAPEASVYISCGTWGLVGVELEHPVLSEAARRANFTNEVGADGRIRFLRNTMGLWLLSESVRHWDRDRVDLGALLEQATACRPPAQVFDTDDPVFASPGDMPDRIAAWYTARGLPPPTTRAETVRAIIESLAAAFADRVETASLLSGTAARTVHIVGGGAQNALLCQLIADRVGAPVVAGPVEATALGNVLIQARTHGLLAGDLEALRSHVTDRLLVGRFTPRGVPGRSRALSGRARS
ncbi:rhamnulokinase [Mycolicibacterium flavescens]|uniref:Carbohydrate kinase n=1 Tax=Mycolicibacterium flavescens TaxID=1776 RepID=A0A1E3RGY9_MYCFV|nr:rhamnulokinase family protein [Mycolicibacterium flavescens]MCV7283097.1 rhamnulokinase [Mycolicibacterium flavescens]ODQ89145.1 carbohydrate kinase [Mycolicibacterium flavescens]